MTTHLNNAAPAPGYFRPGQLFWRANTRNFDAHEKSNGHPFTRDGTVDAEYVRQR